MLSTKGTLAAVAWVREGVLVVADTRRRLEGDHPGVGLLCFPTGIAISIYQLYRLR